MTQEEEPKSQGRLGPGGALLEHVTLVDPSPLQGASSFPSKCLEPL